MEKELTVYGGMIFHEGVQVRAIVAANTKKQAYELFGVTPSHFNGHFSRTGNALELTTATQNPGTVFICRNHFKENRIYQERN